MSDRPLTPESIREALDGFQDPETGRDLVTLGQLHDIELDVDGGKLTLALGLTTFSSPLWESTRQQVHDLLRDKFPQLAEITVELAVHDRPAEPIGQLGLKAKSVIAVGSGKGGVGKSTLAVALAHGLNRAGCKVGLMDADIYGPSIPQLVGSDEQPAIVDDRAQPIMVDGMAVMSMGFLIPAGEAVLWRGPMLHGAITQLFRDIEWGMLDYLIVDLPPGTGDVALSLSQIVPLSGAVVVCTPQDVALLDAVKAVAMFRKMSIDVLGMVENMSHFLCPDCNSRHEIFGSGGARRKAETLDVPFLGEVPVNMGLRVASDQGKISGCFDDPTVAPYLKALAHHLVENLVAQRKKRPVMPSLPVLN